MSMNIAIDASRALREQPTGTEFYSTRIIQYLATVDRENVYWLYTPTLPPDSFPKLPDNFIWKVIPFKRLWSQIRLSVALWLDKPDLLFVPAHVLPLYTPKKTMVTLHDIAFDIFPQAYTTFSIWYNRYAVKRAGRVASAIITPSESAKRDLVKTYGVPSEKIVAIHHGFDSRFAQLTQLSEKVKKHQPYFLMLGRLEERKNTARAIEAFAQFKREAEDKETKLILIGKPGVGYQKIQETINNLPLGIKKDVLELGYVSDEETSMYMRAAIGYVLPSLYEGFGFTLLEAMSAGTPIITSDTSSIPEVVDEAAILINPLSVDEIAHAMKVLATNDLSGEELTKRGIDRVKQFSWEQTAQKTYELIQRVLKAEG